MGVENGIGKSSSGSSDEPKDVHDSAHRYTPMAPLQPATSRSSMSASKLKSKLKFHHLPKPPPRRKVPRSRKSNSRKNENGRVRSVINSLSETLNRKSTDNDRGDAHNSGDDQIDSDDLEDQESDRSNSSIQSIIFRDRIPNFPLSQNELNYIAMTPVELVVENLRESMMSDVPIHQLEVEPENWANVGWYMLSSSAPIIAASIGPLGNLCSTASVADTWRATVTEPVRYPADFAWIYALNGLSLLLGCMSNLSLYMNFTGLINHRLSQTISIGGWYIASMILLGLIIASKYVYFDDDSVRAYDGFWFGVVACILYFIGATLLLINEIGRRLKRSVVPLSITHMQSRLMFLNVIFIVWIGFGGGIFTAMIQGLTFGDAMYFCMGVCLTVAAGDILPKTHLSRTIIIFYAYIGVFLIGLSVASISAAIVESNGTALVYRRIEQARKKKYEKLVAENKFETLKPEDAFHILRRIHRREISNANNQLAFKALLLYAAFLLIGAMAFSLIEGWSYFEGIYFCGLLFVANSFGDFTPKSPGGRTFFVVWAIGAVPMMTILISSLSSTIFTFITEEGDRFTRRLVRITGFIGNLSVFNKGLGSHTKKASHNPFTELERQDSSNAGLVPTSRPGQPLFLKSASTMTNDESDESLFRYWPSSIESNSETDNDGDDDSDSDTPTPEGPAHDSEGNVNEDIIEDIEEAESEHEEEENENENEDNEQAREEREEKQESRKASVESDDEFNDDEGDDDQPDNVAVRLPEESEEGESFDGRVDYPDSEVLVHSGDDPHDDDYEDLDNDEDEPQQPDEKDSSDPQVNKDSESVHKPSNTREKQATEKPNSLKGRSHISPSSSYNEKSPPKTTSKRPQKRVARRSSSGRSSPTARTSSHYTSNDLQNANISTSNLSKIHTRRMLVLIKQVRTLSRTLAQSPETTYSFKEWIRILKVVRLEVGINSSQFWLSPFTPLRVPVVESCFFLLTSLAALDEEVSRIIHFQHGKEAPTDRKERVGCFRYNPSRRRRRPPSSS
ncbi:Tok1p [Sugiyamaella lignohabitans]|uniref:Tok1p n=1 Tax=Sugiyamaella lignohabitans TaxID=796027 RepID=A0A167F5J8_9ASCO|nr:Tok1p [Sugiyamaella lignohabitans]ANB14855.1 Tok1p [Sugiyamaella lignohabitans]